MADGGLFGAIALLLVGMWFWEYLSPGGNPRFGLLRFETTRGDRLFISLLGSAFIHLAWLGLVGPNLWWALALSLVLRHWRFRLSRAGKRCGGGKPHPQTSCNRKPLGGLICDGI